MIRLNAVSSVVAPHRAAVEEMAEFLSRYASESTRPRIRRTLETSRNRTRHTVLPLHELARLQGATERSQLYRSHAMELGERAIGELVRLDVPLEQVTTVIFVSSTGWGAPSVEAELIRRFGLSERCRRIPLGALGCAGGVAAIALAAEIASRRAREHVLVLSVEIPSLQLQLGEPTYWDLVTAGQFGDGAAAAILSSEDRGPEVAATESVLLAESEQGGRIMPCDTGIRLSSSAGLPDLVRSRVAGLVGRFLAPRGVQAHDLAFVAAHPRGAAVLDAVAEGLSLDRSRLAAAYDVWEESANMVSASIFRGLADLGLRRPPSTGDLGLLIAFGTGVACELTLLRWRSGPAIAYAS